MEQAVMQQSIERDAIEQQSIEQQFIEQDSVEQEPVMPPVVRAESGVPRIAVVMPFRDAGRWLPESIASLRGQQGVELELIAVDDGSRDGSAALLQRLWQGCPWPLRLLRLKGQGVSAARNLGWRSSDAPLVAFLDADDVCLPGRLAGQAALLMGDPALAHCLSGWQRLDAEGRVLQSVRPWMEGAGFEAESALRHKAVLPSAWMLRRQALEAMGGFETGLHHAEDVDLLLRLALAGRRGRWLEQVACGYRVHEGGASRQVRQQTRSLLWVVERQLRRLPAAGAAMAPDMAADIVPATETGRLLRRELRYTTRAWAGWKAWVEGDGDLALELWRTALGLSPLPPLRSWLHLAEQARRSCLREGLPWQPQALLASPPWQALGRELVGRWPWWGERELEALRRDLLRSLGPDPGASPWWPERLLDQLDERDPLRDLRARLLHTARQLVRSPADQPLPADLSLELRRELAAIAGRWAALCWSEDPRPAARQLELSLMLDPSPGVLAAYARLQRREHPGGAAAVEQLAALLTPATADRMAQPPAPRDARPPNRSAPEQPPTPSDPWQPDPWLLLPPAPQAEPCQGPACPACGERLLADWERRPLAGGGLLWQAPASQRPAADLSPPQADPPWRIHQLAGGRCWIRRPSNVWGMTHGLGVAAADGMPLPELCRRYPQPWPSCRQPPSAPEPPPADEPERIEGVVLAVADLSAEIYYHWLLEQLPRLGLALERLPAGIDRRQLRIWHNGGSSRVVAEGLQRGLGLAPQQLLTASVHPHISADLLLVPDFAGNFGWPSRQASQWLRQRYLDPATAEPCRRRLWLGRGGGWRRPVIQEAATLERLEPFGLEPLDPAGLSLEQQAALLASAELVVLPHGGAMANLVFAQPGTRVLELHSPHYHPPYAHGLALVAGLRLASCAQPQAPPRLYREWLYEGPILEPILLEPQRIAACLADLLSQ